MDILDYLNPIELDRPEDFENWSDDSIIKTIELYTENKSVEDLSEYDVVIIGIPEDRNSRITGSAKSPDVVRNELYKLISHHSIKILDLGNIKNGTTFSDTYVAVREVFHYLLCQNANVIAIGGTQELTVPIYQAFEQYQDKINVATVDNKIDFKSDAINISPDTFLSEILLNKQRIFKYINLGQQIYLTDKSSLNVVESMYHQAVRLGDLRDKIEYTEHILRDIDLVSFDIGVVKQGDAPASMLPSPNGLLAHEACQISRYCGVSDRLRVLLLSNIIPDNDINHQTSKLLAQMIWYFFEGISCREVEFPSEENNYFKKFIVQVDDIDRDIEFYKSKKTQRWWINISTGKEMDGTIVPCHFDDYVLATKQEVPEIWWKYFQKMS